MPAPIFKPEQVDKAAQVLLEGGLVAFPTDTVYGVAALADSGLSNSALQAFKGGRSEPFSLHLPDVAAALKFAAPLRDLERHAVRQLGPRGVTVIVARDTDRSGLGLRIVQHETGSRFLSLAKAPVVATSANLHGQPTLNDPAAIAELPGVAAVLSAGELPERPASSVVRMLRCGIEVLREGAAPVATLSRWFTRVLEFVCLGNLNRSAFAHHLLEAMQNYYADEIPGFVSAFQCSSSGVIARSNTRSPADMCAAAARYSVVLANHGPTRFDPHRPGERRLISMGDDIWDDVAEADSDAVRWATHDPMGGPPAEYASTAAQVRSQVETLLARTARVRDGDAHLEAEFDKLFSPDIGAGP